MSNDDKMTQIYENMTKKSIQSSELYDHKERSLYNLIGYPSGTRRSTDMPSKSTTTNKDT